MNCSDFSKLCQVMILKNFKYFFKICGSVAAILVAFTFSTLVFSIFLLIFVSKENSVLCSLLFKTSENQRKTIQIQKSKKINPYRGTIVIWNFWNPTRAGEGRRVTKSPPYERYPYSFSWMFLRSSWCNKFALGAWRRWKNSVLEQYR